MAKGKNSSPKARVFFIMQYECNPRTGEKLMDEQQVRKGIQYRSIKQWAFIRHDKDKFSVEDEEREYNALKIFREQCLVDKTVDERKKRIVSKLWQIEDIEKAVEDAFSLDLDEFARRYQRQLSTNTKPAHWHIALKLDVAVEVNTIARWFGVPPQYVEIAKSKDTKNNAGAFLDCVEYLTHENEKEQSLGKYRYDNSEVVANFDWRTALNERISKRAKYGRDISEKDEIRQRVLFEGLTLAELCSTEKGRLAYAEDYSTLDKFRLKYIQDKAPMPDRRINYYVCGNGGIGKGLMCKALARALYPDIQNDEDVYFEVGASGASFEGYDGQPVVIWNDFRASELLRVLGDRGNVFKVFDTFPSGGRGRQNIKYSSITLINEINIVNSVQDFQEFLDELAGDYKNTRGKTEKAEDKKQSYRRFPMIMPLHESDFDLLMNKGVLEGSREYDQWVSYQNLRGSMQKIANMLNGDPVKRRELESGTVQFVMEKHKELAEKLASTTMTDEEIEREFADYGKPTKPPVIITMSCLDYGKLSENSKQNEYKRLKSIPMDKWSEEESRFFSLYIQEYGNNYIGNSESVGKFTVTTMGFGLEELIEDDE